MYWNIFYTSIVQQSCEGKHFFLNNYENIFIGMPVLRSPSTGDPLHL